MKTKLVIQLSILLVGLVLVVFMRSLSDSGGFTAGLNALFGTDTRNQLNWCADDVVDVAWVSAKVPVKLKNLDMNQLRSKYCKLKIEAISGVDIDKVSWEKLAESSGATGKNSLLEWNSELGVFRSGGMPFKSSEFSRELLDK